jgi:hypothetical protein
MWWVISVVEEHTARGVVMMFKFPKKLTRKQEVASLDNRSIYAFHMLTKMTRYANSKLKARNSFVSFVFAQLP